MTNIMSHRFLTGDRLDDNYQPHTKVLKTVRNGQQLFEGKTTMIESLIQNRFVSEINARFGTRNAPKVFQSLDETGIPIIESTIKGRWIFQGSKKKPLTDSRQSKDFISKNKVHYFQLSLLLLFLKLLLLFILFLPPFPLLLLLLLLLVFFHLIYIVDIFSVADLDVLKTFYCLYCLYPASSSSKCNRSDAFEHPSLAGKETLPRR